MKRTGCVSLKSAYIDGCVMSNFGTPPFFKGQIAMQIKYAFIGALASAALIAAPVTSASAHGYRHGGLFWGLGALAGAAVVGAATIATAPLRVLSGPGYYGPPRVAYAPGYYAPPAGYYAAPAPQYYAPPPPPAYYAPPAAYYGAPPGYYGR